MSDNGINTDKLLPIIAFSKDYFEDPTSNHHILEGLAKHTTVIWLNSIASRNPNFGNARDVKKIFHKIIKFLRGPVNVKAQLWVMTPLVLPFPYSRAAQRINLLILKITLFMVRLRVGIFKEPYQLWSFIPTAAYFVHQLKSPKKVYYCTDDWSQFSFVKKDDIVKIEKLMCASVDLVFATAGSLVDKCRKMNENTYLISHGVNYGHFATAVYEDIPVPLDIKDIRGPIAGFFGLIEDWIDLDLIRHAAAVNPDVTFVLIGKVLVDVGSFKNVPNVRFLGRKAFSELPAYCRGFSMGLIPFKMNELTKNVNPIKLKEYLSAGLPVISTPLPEVLLYSDQCRIASGSEEFANGVLFYKAGISKELRMKLSDSMRGETWEEKVTKILALLRGVNNR
ncbi:MAG: glycosyltransferase [Verrucomicrobiota bacterium]|nr:glycosyltransferase [Verrucomicrobiota bacterium]